MKKCSELLSEKTILASNTDNIDFGAEEGIRCIDPKNAFTTKFSDELASGKDELEIRLLTCEELLEYNVVQNVDCMSEDEFDKWFEDHSI